MKSRYAAQLAFGLALAALVPLAAGCGHESAASPGSAPPSEVQAAPVSAEPVGTADATAVEPAPAESGAADPVATSAAPVGSARPEDPANDAEPPRKIGQRPPADRGPARPGDAEKITFDDLNLGMPADVVFRPFMLSDRVKELEGKRISILGFIHGAPESRKGIKEFILLKNTECKYGPQGQADHLTEVFLGKDKTTDYTNTAIKVEGTLTIEPVTGTDGNTWSVFRLEDAVVK